MNTITSKARNGADWAARLLNPIFCTPEQQALKMQLHCAALESADAGNAFEDVASAHEGSLSQMQRLHAIDEVRNELLGLGPLEPLLSDPTVSDILVNSAKIIYVERGGKLELTPLTFQNDAHLLAVIHKIVGHVGRSIDEACPLVDARLPDGSRVNATIPPVTIDGPTLSIRRFGRAPLRPEDLVGKQALTQGMMDLLKSCIAARLNVVVSGGTGSGKTTLLNAVSSFISSDERLVSIEDAAELRLQQKHIVRMETRPPTATGLPAITIRQMVVNALRMRPDRIIVGEVRGEEALDMLQAMNTGHDGSLTTVHANNPREALSRIEVMVGMANGNMSVRAIRQQITSAIDLVIHVSRYSDGTRKVSHITECQGMESDVVTMQDVFVFEKSGISAEGKVTGRFRATGIRPKFTERFKALGIEVPTALFTAIEEVN